MPARLPVSGPCHCVTPMASRPVSARGSRGVAAGPPWHPPAPTSPGTSPLVPARPWHPCRFRPVTSQIQCTTVERVTGVATHEWLLLVWAVRGVSNIPSAPGAAATTATTGAAAAIATRVHFTGTQQGIVSTAIGLGSAVPEAHVSSGAGAEGTTPMRPPQEMQFVPMSPRDITVM